MLSGTILAIIAIAPALALLWLQMRGRPRHYVEWGAATLWGLVLAGSSWSALQPPPPFSEPTLPTEVLAEDYVSSRECRACHADSHASWSASYHSSMTRYASPDTVLAHFDGSELAHKRERVRVDRQGNRFVATFAATADAEATEREVVMTTGSHHFQIYWTSSGEGRELELFPFAHQIREDRWIATDHMVLADPRRSELDSIWNLHCIGCHSTLGRPKMLSESKTEVVELGVACESCHGPGAEHVSLNRDPQRRYRLHMSGAPDESIVNPARLPHDRASEVCGQCHSVHIFHSFKDTEYWSEHGFPFRPGDELAASKKIVDGDSHQSIAGETAFWSDEMVRVNGREYNSLLKTPCYTRGELSCLSCHSLHQDAGDPRERKVWANDQLGAEMRGNQACVNCHSEFAGDSELTAHTRHAPESAGSLCYDCHMPHTAYGLHKATRSHQMSSPSVRVELATGRPNACNLCHIDKSLGWTEEHLQGWVDEPPNSLNDSQRHIATGVAWSLSGDAGLRALAAWHMGYGPTRETSGSRWMAPYLAELLVDDYPAVRSVASRSLSDLPGFEDVSAPFNAPAASRREAKQQVKERWQKSRPKHPAAFRLLLKDGHKLNESLFREMRRRRDRSFVWLQE